jgi:hypothetical protein
MIKNNKSYKLVSGIVLLKWLELELAFVGIEFMNACCTLV